MNIFIGPAGIRLRFPEIRRNSPVYSSTLLRKHSEQDLLGSPEGVFCICPWPIQVKIC